MRSSPDENLPTSQNPPSHKLKRSRVVDAGRSPSQQESNCSPPKRSEHPQRMAERAMYVLGISDSRQQYCSNGVGQSGPAWNQVQQPAQPRSKDVSEKEWDNNPDVDGQVCESTMHSANGILPKRKRHSGKQTKTGCITCRRRKKKCGEEAPQCKLMPMLHDRS